MIQITKAEFDAKHPDFKGVWTVEREDWPNWAEVREQYMGKRTMLGYDNGTVLLIEGSGFEIVEGE